MIIDFSIHLILFTYIFVWMFRTVIDQGLFILDNEMVFETNDIRFELQE